jgi:hypothetical protein
MFPVIVNNSYPRISGKIVEGYGGSTAYAGNVKEAARRETCAETFYDAF